MSRTHSNSSCKKVAGRANSGGIKEKNEGLQGKDLQEKVIQRIISDFENVRSQKGGYIFLSSQLPSQSQDIGGEEESLFKNGTIRCPEEVFSKWFTIENWSEELTRMLNELKDEEVGWQVSKDGTRTELVSPLGFELILK